jgi:hypothetical protein
VLVRSSQKESIMIKQLCFFRKRPDMTLEQFMDYYENQHSQLSKRMGKAPSIAGAQRYVRRYLKPEKNPVTGEVIDPGYDCIMEAHRRSGSPAAREGRRAETLRFTQQSSVHGRGVRLAHGPQRRDADRRHQIRPLTF